MRACGAPTVGTRSVKMRWAQPVMRQTGSLEHVARHLGHAQIETSRIYAKWSDATLREALSAW